MRIDHHEVVVRYQVRFNAVESEVLLAHPEWKRWLNVSKQTTDGSYTIASLTRTQLRMIAELLDIDDDLLPDLRPASTETVGEPYPRMHSLRYLTDGKRRLIQLPCTSCGAKP